MVESNIKIIEELKEVLNIINTDLEIKKKFTESETDFTRDRKLTFNRTVFLIINMLKRSLAIEVQEFFEKGIDSPINCTKVALTIQRKKIKSSFFEVLNKQFTNSFYHFYGENVKKWKGFLVIAIDGSTACLFNKESVIAHFGCGKNQFTQTPLARVIKYYDVLNKFVIFSKICPITTGESTIVGNHIQELPVNSLSIYDRGFAGFPLMYLLINQEVERQFVIRCRTDFNKPVIAFMKSTATDTVVNFYPDHKAKMKMYQYGYKAFTTTSIKVRMVKVVLKTGEIEVLLTNLYDTETYKTACFKDLYFMRWGVETSYDTDKNKLQLEQFSGHSVWSIEQDFYATTFVSNLQCIIEKQCEPYVKNISKNRKYDYQINKNVSIGSMKNKIVKLFLTQDPEVILLHLQKLFEKSLEPIRPNRNFPRKFGGAKPKGKFNTLTNYKRAV